METKEKEIIQKSQLTRCLIHVDAWSMWKRSFIRLSEIRKAIISDPSQASLICLCIFWNNFKRNFINSKTARNFPKQFTKLLWTWITVQKWALSNDAKMDIIIVNNINWNVMCQRQTILSNTPNTLLELVLVLFVCVYCYCSAHSVDSVFHSGISTDAKHKLNQAKPKYTKMDSVYYRWQCVTSYRNAISLPWKSQWIVMNTLHRISQ